MFAENLKRFSTLKFSWIIASFVIILSILLAAGLIFGTQAGGETLYVDDDANPGGNGSLEKPYQNVQDAVDNSIGGETIRVFNGTYLENVVVDKTLSLFGNGSANTTIDGGGSDDVVRIEVDWSNLSGFNVTNGGDDFQDFGIEIESDHNTISNNTISNNGNYGIYLGGDDNTITNNKISNNDYQGIYLIGDDNTITNNKISNNDNQGIYLGGDDNTISNNNLSNNDWDGIYLIGDDNTISNNNLSNNSYGICLDCSAQNTLTKNSMTENSIYIRGYSLEHWNTHAISTSNTVNGKPVYYHRNATGFTVDSGAGQVILANCTFITAENQNCSNGSVGILVGYSSNITILNNTLNSRRGILFYESSSNTILNNTISNNLKGIQLLKSSNNIISNNTISNPDQQVNIFGDSGININQNSRNNNLSKNHISKYDLGISLDGSRNNTIFENTIWNTTMSGVRCWESTYNVLQNNILMNNEIGINLRKDSHNNIAHNNIISNHTKYGIYASENAGYYINATKNYWGDISGPYHTENNPKGTGDNVTDYVLFDPWLGKDEYYTKYVDDDAPDGGDGSKEQPFNRIQDAIDNADGMTVRVFNGTYHENVVVNKTLSLIGNGSANTTIDGGADGDVVTIEADWSNLSGFNVTNAGDDGIEIESNYNTISNNTISNNEGTGIYLRHSAQNTILNNTILNNDDGIYIADESSNNTISNNTISNNDDGIFLYRSEENTISNNTISNNGADGIHLHESSSNTISNNTISNNTILNNGDYGSGIYLWDSDQNNISNNTIPENNIGIKLEDSSQNNTAHNNTIFNNTNYGINATYNNGYYINATNNWWGSNSGPYHTENNTKGTGDNVTDYVLFDPWLGKDEYYTKYVDDDAPDGGDGTKEHPYNRIQDAIDNATDGMTVRVFNGTYLENVVVNKTLSLIGNGSANTTTIIGDGNSSVILVTVDRVNISMFKITGSKDSFDYAGIKVTANHTRIFNNNCTGNYAGVFLNNSNNNTVYENRFWNNSFYGLQTHTTDYGNIYNNTCKLNNYGMSIAYSTNYTITNNNCSNNSVTGISLSGYARDHYVRENECFNNSDSGIYLEQSQDCTVTNNLCQQNTRGISFQTSSKNILNNNSVTNNAETGFSLQTGCENNTFWNNTISFNTDYGIHLETQCNNNNFTENEISFNGIGIFLESSLGNINENNSAFNNSIVNNTYFGINATENEGGEINATYNWWGNNSGPYHPVNNTGGTGDNVTDDVFFDPWTGKDDLPSPEARVSHDLIFYIDENQNVNLDAAPSTGYGLTFNWSFGDDNFSENMTTDYGPYNFSGSYKIKLTVTDSLNRTDSLNVTLIVNNTAPSSASITGGNKPGEEEDKKVTFEATASDTPNDQPGLIYSWDFGDGEHGLGQNTEHFYSESGDYTVNLTVMDDDGATDTDQIQVTVSNVVPTAISEGFYTDPVYIGDEVVFSGAKSTDTTSDVEKGLTFSWDFDDGSGPGNGKVISHSFDNPGTYDIVLTVTDDNDDSDSPTSPISITVEHREPVAKAVSNLTNVLTGENITFDAINSFDPDEPVGQITNWSWDLDNGDMMYDKAFSYNYSTPGSYNVTLTVTDNHGGVSLPAKIMITVLNEMPTDPEIQYEGNTSQGKLINFTGTAQDEDNLTYSWDFGDGSQTADGSVTNHTYANPGTFTVTLTVSDDYNEVSITEDVTISNIPPIANFTASKTTAAQEEEIIFNASKSYDEAEDELNYTWNFGDGTTAYGMEVTHSYSNSGTKTVKLVVNDGAENSQEFSLQVEITNSAPEAKLTVETNKTETGKLMLFDARGSSDPSDDQLSYTWNFGDNSTEKTGIVVTHTYAAEGGYTVTLTVSDGEKEDTAQKQITVEKGAGGTGEDKEESSGMGMVSYMAIILVIILLILLIPLVIFSTDKNPKDLTKVIKMVKEGKTAKDLGSSQTEAEAVSGEGAEVVAAAVSEEDEGATVEAAVAVAGESVEVEKEKDDNEKTMELKKEMKTAASKEEFEEAIKIRDELNKERERIAKEKAEAERKRKEEEKRRKQALRNAKDAYEARLYTHNKLIKNYTKEKEELEKEMKDQELEEAKKNELERQKKNLEEKIEVQEKKLKECKQKEEERLRKLEEEKKAKEEIEKAKEGEAVAAAVVGEGEEKDEDKDQGEIVPKPQSLIELEEQRDKIDRMHPEDDNELERKKSELEAYEDYEDDPDYADYIQGLRTQIASMEKLAKRSSIGFPATSFIAEKNQELNDIKAKGKKKASKEDKKKMKTYPPKIESFEQAVGQNIDELLDEIYAEVVEEIDMRIAEEEETWEQEKEKVREEAEKKKKKEEAKEKGEETEDHDAEEKETDKDETETEADDEAEEGTEEAEPEPEEADVEADTEEAQVEAEAEAEEDETGDVELEADGIEVEEDVELEAEGIEVEEDVEAEAVEIEEEGIELEAEEIAGTGAISEKTGKKKGPKISGNKVTCDKCSTTLAIGTKKRPYAFKCPKCGNKITLPGKKGAKGKTGKSTVTCPGCKTQLMVGTKKRPYSFNCPKCKKRITLEKKGGKQPGTPSGYPGQGGRYPMGGASWQQNKYPPGSTVNCPHCRVPLDVSGMPRPTSFSCPSCRNRVDIQ